MPDVKTVPEVRVYRYRWVVLGVFMFLTAMTQVLWITFAPITSVAAQFYGTSDLMIGLLSMSFMLAYVLVVIPAAWLIDTRGFRFAVGTGAVISAGFALARGFGAGRFLVVFLSQLGIALGQPLVIGAITKLAATWFPARERATASGLGTLAMYIGILVAMIVTPPIVLRFGMSRMLIGYGVVTALAAVLFLLFGRGAPPTPASQPGQEARTRMFEGLKQMLRQKDFILLLAIFFIGLGMFNAVSTWIEDIVRPRGFTVAQAGLVGGLMLIGGIVGAGVIPIFSDRARRRKPFMLLSIIGLIPGLLGMTFATDYGLLLVSGFVLGFFLLSSGPIGFQYGAELTSPAPEGTSNSLLLVAGQISGMAFIFGMDALRAPGGAMTKSLLILTGLVAACILFAALLRESPIARKKTG